MPDWRVQLEAAVTRGWYQGSSWLWLLWPLSKLFQLATWWRRRQMATFPPDALPIPVVVIGGITVGGTGKTPVIIALVRSLTARGLRVGVVSRGYGGSHNADDDKPFLVTARSTAAQVGDEPLLIALSTEASVAVGRDRSAAVRLLAKQCHLDLVLSDDGLQHYSMPRDFEVVVLDAQRGLGNGHLLPMGPLREGAWRLGEVDWILERNGEQPDTSFRYSLSHFRHWRSRATLHPSMAPARWSNCTIAAVTALGQPEQFFTVLEQLGLEISQHAFPDHYALTKSDLDAVWGDVVVITEKDAVKIESFDDDRIWVLAIEALIPAALVDTLVEKFGTKLD